MRSWPRPAASSMSVARSIPSLFVGSRVPSLSLGEMLRQRQRPAQPAQPVGDRNRKRVYAQASVRPSRARRSLRVSRDR